MKYALSSHAHLCVTDDYAVLLDLKRDEYLAIRGPELRALELNLRGWPLRQGAPAAPLTPAEVSDDTARTLQQLVERGVITTEPCTGANFNAPSIPVPQTSLLEAMLVHELFKEGSETKPRVAIGNVRVFLVAYATALFMLKYRSIERAVGQARARKRSHFERGGAVVDMEETRRLVWAFRSIRPFVFSGKEACLLDSLALIEFLARYRQFPTWVFGVKTSPFAAHCWIQDGDIVLNDTPDNVRRFKPILTI